MRRRLLRPGNDVPFPTDHTPPTLHIARVIRHHVVLAPMLTQTGHDLAAHAPTIDDHTNSSSGTPRMWYRFVGSHTNRPCSPR